MSGEREKTTKILAQLLGCDPSEVRTRLDEYLLAEQECIWPCTVIPSRYGGAYEGGDRPNLGTLWLAFPLSHDEIPAQVHGDDIECMEWFSDHGEDPIGRGPFPGAALDDLRNCMDAMCAEGRHAQATTVPLDYPGISEELRGTYYCHHCKKRWR